MKMSSPNRIGIGLLAVLLGAIRLLAEDIPVRNWTVPSSASGGLSKLDLTPPRPFIGLTPCRLVDTRPSQGFPPAWGAPILAANATRDFDLNSAPHCSGIPDSADAYSLNITVTETAGAGDVRIWPAGSPPLIVSTQNWPAAGVTLANAAIVPAGTNGAITVQVAGSNTHLIIDINGYFSDVQGTPSNFFRLVGNVTDPDGAVVAAENTGIGTGVLGYINADGGGIGVLGRHAGAGIGVFGLTLGTSGVSLGVLGRSNSSSNDSAGVFGLAGGTTGRTFGVDGVTGSIDQGAAGVRGVDGTGTAASGFFPSAGVRGESQFAFGVLGVVRDGGDAAVSGILSTSGGTPLVQGSLGRDAGANHYAVFAFGDYGGNGAKYFVEPHPRNADLVIRYVALEGPESGTYFRGRGKFQNGVATIEVPEDFRMVTDEEGLSVQITPIGGMASVGVLRIGLDGIVVQGSRNLEFFYLVQGVRRSHKHLRPVGPGQEYMPESPDAAMPAYVTEVQKKMLISNGTYKADGTVNMETAKALGWDKVWEKRAKRSGADTSGGLR